MQPLNSEIGDRFKEIAGGHYQRIWSFVYYLTGFSPDSEDLVQQVFLAAFDRLSEGLDSIHDPEKWLRGTARNVVHLWWREKRRLSPRAAQALLNLAEQADDATDAALKTEATQALAQCLQKLSEDDRHLVVERYQRGLPIAQIATRLNQNAATVRVRLFRIRNALRTCVRKRAALEGSR